MKSEKTLADLIDQFIRCYRANKLVDADKASAKAVKLVAEHPELLKIFYDHNLQIVDLLCQFGDCDRADVAIADLRKSLPKLQLSQLQLDDANAMLHHKNALNQLNRGKFSEAVEDFEHAAPLYKNGGNRSEQERAGFFYAYGRTLERTKKFKEAVKVQATALEAYGRCPQSPQNINAVKVIRQFMQQIPQSVKKAADRNELEQLIDVALNRKPVQPVTSLSEALSLIKKVGLAPDLDIDSILNAKPELDPNDEVDPWLICEILDTQYANNLVAQSTAPKRYFLLDELSTDDDNEGIVLLGKLLAHAKCAASIQNITFLESLEGVKNAANKALSDAGNASRFIQLDSAEDEMRLVLLTQTDFEMLKKANVILDSEYDVKDSWHDQS